MFPGAECHRPLEALKLVLFELQAVQGSLSQTKRTEQKEEVEKVSNRFPYVCCELETLLSKRRFPGIRGTALPARSSSVPQQHVLWCPEPPVPCRCWCKLQALGCLTGRNRGGGCRKQGLKARRWRHFRLACRQRADCPLPRCSKDSRALVTSVGASQSVFRGAFVPK